MRPNKLPFLAGLFTITMAILLIISGCKKDDAGTGPGPIGLNVSPTAVAVAAGSMATATIRGGTRPYSIAVITDTILARVTLANDSVLTVTGVSSGTTSFRVRDNDSTLITVNVTVTGAITVNLFPFVAGHAFVYTGYATSSGSPGGTPLPDTGHVYNTKWIVYIDVPSPTGGTGRALIDTTTLRHPLAGVITVGRTLLIRKDSLTNDFSFLQTLGPFFRAFSIARTDTFRWFVVASPNVGVGGTWTALDSTYTGAAGTVRLQILGVVENYTSITDSSAAHVQWNTYHTKTVRNIFLNGTQVITNQITSELWLAPNVGPIQVYIGNDTENLGHFRVLKLKNF